MARDLFGDVTRPFNGAGGRSRFTVPLSLAAHTLVVAVVVVVPLLAADVLPALNTRLAYADYTPVVPPEPPPPPAFRPPGARPPVVADPNAAPTLIPDGIAKEPDWQRVDRFDAFNTVSIVAGGVEDGLQVLPAPPPPPRQDVPPATVRVGQVSPPTKVRDVAPVYPAIAQSARVQGVVIIQATIGTDGTVVDATVLRSVPLLDAAALVAVRQWRYTPTTLNGIPVAVIMTVTVNFQLR
jgi:periplasmic protein TonB